MRVAILHDRVTDESAPDALDVLVQAGAVSRALEGLGHEPCIVACDLDLAALAGRLGRERPDAVFNLVESLDGHGRLIHLVPALLDALGLPYTGAPGEAMFLTSGKLLCKRRLRAGGLPTPDWIAHPARPDDPVPEAAGTWIVKSAWEHASIGLDDDSIVAAGAAEALARILASRARGLGGECFAERFVDGREFNLSVLADRGRPEVLPPAEIVFDAFPEDKPRIVGYAAKWRAGSFEYDNTPRRFDFDPSDRPLVDELVRLASDAWNAFGLRGYARVDFRVDGGGRPWILEINANPCLSPDAGFAAALERARVAYDEAIGRILEDASTPSG
jgi:D-alanine-D-alanine ligase